MTRRRGPSKEQKDLMQRFYDHTCFEFMGIHKVSADDPQGFVEEWNRNIQWLRDVVEETDSFISGYEEAERPLSPEGYGLRNMLAEEGVELTPEELLDSIDEAIRRVAVTRNLEEAE